MDLDGFKSPNDAKQYRVLTLANGLEALLIHSDKRGRAHRHSDGEAEPEPENEASDDDDNEYPAPRRSLVNRSGGYDTESDSDDDDDDDGGDEEGGGGDRHDAPPEKGSPLAAACLSVAVGSMADPRDLRGLAHYLEHMLFMGSAKYPDENAFEAFLSAHGGYSNGTTECESTRFLFEVAPAYLQEALDMFAQFFVAPLFKADAMDRELLAIESEFNRARQNDYVRLQQVQCETCGPPGSVYDSFGWGNMRSLKHEPEQRGRDVRAEMIAFYKQHYSAHRMKLCVYGEDSLDDLERWVRASFDAVPTSSTQPVKTPRPVVPVAPIPFGMAAGQAPTLVKIVPVRRMHALHLYWPLPPLLSEYRQKPWEFLSHAMGHEADGSLSAILRDRMWATEVAVGISENDAYEFGSFGSLFEVNVTLTALGLSNWERVVALVFDVVRFLQARVASSGWIFNELRASSRMNFQFQEESHPLSLCRRMAELLQDRHGIAREDLLRYDLLQGEFDARRTAELMGFMTPQNMRVVLLSHSFEDEASAAGPTWRRERWLDVPYAIEPIAREKLQLWASTSKDTPPLTLPEPNPFMPEDFSVLPIEAAADGTPLDPDGEPLLVHATPMSKLWYKRDVKFRIPKTNANFLLCLPSITRSVENYVHAKIYLRLCHEALQHVQYQSYLASYSYELSIRDLDIEATFSGFSDKLPVLIRAVLGALLHTEVDDAVFARVRDELTKEYRNLTLKPAVKARYLRLQLLERTAFPVEDKLRVLEHVRAADVRHFKHHVLWQCDAAVRAMVHGNIAQADAVALLTAVETAIVDHARLAACEAEAEEHGQTLGFKPLLSLMRPHTTELPLTTNGLLLRDVSDHDGETNSIVEVYYQVGKSAPGEFADLAYAELLQHVMAEPLFHELRTMQQLGYEVYCMVRETHGVLGFSISVQSASHAAGEIALRVDEFVEVIFRKQLEQLPMEELTKHVASLHRMKTREDATLSEESDRYWEEIQSRRLEFRIDDHVVKELAQCSVAGLLERYQRWLLAASEAPDESDPLATKVRKLRVHVIGKNSKFVRPLETLVAEEDAPQIISNWREYKAALMCHCLSRDAGTAPTQSRRHSHGHGHGHSHGYPACAHAHQHHTNRLPQDASSSRFRSRSRSLTLGAH